MNEEPKSIWKKSLHLPQMVGAWLGLMVATMFILLVVKIIINETFEISWLMIFGAVSATVLFLGWIVIRWLFCWRNLKRSLFALACFATLTALFYAEEDWRGWHAWNAFKQEWMAKGEKFDFKDFVPPPVPDDQNFALTPVVASCYDYILTHDGKKIPSEQRDKNAVNRLMFDLGDNSRENTNGVGYWAKGTLSNLKLWQGWYRELAAKTNQFAVPAVPGSPAADVLLALGKYDATVEELRQASLLPESRFPLNYDSENPAEILLPHLAALKMSSLLLRLRALAELENGQSDKALADVKLELRLIESFRMEPFLISHLVRLAMMDIMLQPVYEGLANHQWTDAQLVVLDVKLAKLDFLADYQFSMRGEVGTRGGIFDFLRQHPNELANLLGEYDQQNEDAFSYAQFIPSGWFYQNQLRSARFVMQNYLPIVDVKRHTASPAMAHQAESAFETEYRQRTPYNFIERILIQALSGVSKKNAREQISVDLARTAIALERYRLAHGEYPESLNVLAPQFITQLPHDVIGGGPLKYRREVNDQFVLYSVGWNERDDGGVTGYRNSGSPNFDLGDWVWRYPAK